MKFAQPLFRTEFMSDMATDLVINPQPTNLFARHIKAQQSGQLNRT
ncbi:hypothetical protein OF001_U220025 [Pseudomonas sp. OF001]|nr:hypothetical protein OF001_U220025 [Pseudomonas sp. OF001]